MKNVYIILVNPKKSVNVGASIRAMNVFGLNNLRIVTKRAKYPPHTTIVANYVATQHALPILNSTTTHTTLEEAVADMHYVIGTTRKSIKYQLPFLELNELTPSVLQRESENFKIAILFGNEGTGLSPEDFNWCHSLLTIPCQASLNLSHAVSTVAYELYKQHLELTGTNEDGSPNPKSSKSAVAQSRPVTPSSPYPEDHPLHGFSAPPTAPRDLITMRDLGELEAKVKTLLTRIKWEDVSSHDLEYTMARLHSVASKCSISKKELNLMFRVLRKVNESLPPE